MSDSETKALLTPIEARILGCLVEKEATTPEQYPLTENSLWLACNQKTSRDPVMDLQLGDVGHALRQLEIRKLVRSQHGSRAQRYEHRLADGLQVTRQQQALLAILLLRGAQTAAELLSRCERLARFADVDDVQHALDRLQQREPALAQRLPKAPGQREERYVHLLCGAPQFSNEVFSERGGGSSSRAPLEARIEALEARLAALESALGMAQPAAE